MADDQIRTTVKRWHIPAIILGAVFAWNSGFLASDDNRLPISIAFGTAAIVLLGIGCWVADRQAQ